MGQGGGGVWDAVDDDPGNAEYRLHLHSPLFQASQMYMRIGNTAAQEKDYQGAYVAYRKAYGYDPVNELAKAEMARMVRMQEALQKGNDPTGKPPTTINGVSVIPTSYPGQQSPDTQLPQRLEKIHDVPFPGGVDLQYIVKELAKDLDLNVLFDAESRLENRRIRIELKNVTADELSITSFSRRTFSSKRSVRGRSSSRPETGVPTSSSLFSEPSILRMQIRRT